MLCYILFTQVVRSNVQTDGRKFSTLFYRTLTPSGPLTRKEVRVDEREERIERIEGEETNDGFNMRSVSHTSSDRIFITELNHLSLPLITA